jgi:hypothetical protein
MELDATSPQLAIHPIRRRISAIACLNGTFILVLEQGNKIGHELMQLKG